MVMSESRLKIAVVGCSHGELDVIYETLAHLERENNIKVSLLICCGDFQAIRNFGDLHHMAVREKYHHLQSFYKYYSGELKAPVLTLFIGGNHESTGYLSELPYGGWVAPDIYYLGYAGVVRFAGLRIAGISGIFKSHDYNKNHFECPPFTENSKRSAYHVRSVDIFRLKQLKSPENHPSAPLDVFISHDWPRGIVDFGDVRTLLRIKPFFRQDIERNQLGNPATMTLLQDLHPRYWFSAHLHVKFPALICHDNGDTTRFLALDKTILKSQFLQVLDIDIFEQSSNESTLEYDEKWLAILKMTDHLISLEPRTIYMPGPRSSDGERFDFRPTDEEITQIRHLFNNDFRIPKNFRRTAPVHSSELNMNSHKYPPSAYYRNPQTSEFCSRLAIVDINAVLANKNTTVLGIAHYLSEGRKSENPDEIELDDEEIEDFFESESQFRNKNSEPLAELAFPLWKPEIDAYSESPPEFVAPSLKKHSLEEKVNVESTKMKRRNEAIYAPNGDSDTVTLSVDD